MLEYFSNILIIWSCLILYNKYRTDLGVPRPPSFHLSERSEKSRASTLDVFTKRREVE